MKNKNIALGFVAVLFAVGGAFASNSLILGKYVKAGTPLACKAIVDVECGVAGPRACAVVIDGTVYSPVYTDAACTQALTTTMLQPIPTEFEE